jgi:hypothetical protein
VAAAFGNFLDAAGSQVRRLHEHGSEAALALRASAAIVSNTDADNAGMLGAAAAGLGIPAGGLGAAGSLGAVRAGFGAVADRGGGQ